MGSVEGEGEEDLSGPATDPSVLPLLWCPHRSPVEGQTPSWNLQRALTLPPTPLYDGILFQCLDCLSLLHSWSLPGQAYMFPTFIKDN